MTINRQIEIFDAISKAIEDNKDHKYIFGRVMDLTKADYKRMGLVNPLPQTPTEIAIKYVKGQHGALTDNQEIKDLEREIETHKNGPLVVRPMSELSNFKNLYGDFLVFDSNVQLREYEEFELKNGEFTLNPKDCKIKIKFNEHWVCKDNEGSIFLGFIEKPNPNDIKL